ncbi:MAG TPA: hypothetical protein VK636_01505 [Gemmatimonadaceae bacterium]|nr:hypothetical protein [Gemmatimonadaceae bacterium]
MEFRIGKERGNSPSAALATVATACERARFVVVAASLLAACTDKPTPAQSSSNLVQLQLVTKQGQLSATSTIDVSAGYLERNATRVVLAKQSIAANSSSTQHIEMTVDLTACLADTNRESSDAGCPLRVTVTLRDAAAVALDSSEVGPIATTPGHAPSFPEIDLAANRYGVIQWAGDEALRLGGPDAPFTLSAPTTGFASGQSPPVIYSASQDTLAGPRLQTFQNGTWHSTPSGLGRVVFNQLAVVSPSEIWIASNAGLYLYNGMTFALIGAVPDTLLSVAALNTGGGGRLVVAGGTAGVLWQGDGVTWKKISLGANQGIHDACITAANEAFVAGAVLVNNAVPFVGTGTIWRFDGTSWASTSSTSTQVKVQLQCPGVGVAYAIIANGGGFLKWNGSSWAPPTINTVPVRTLNWGVASANEIYAYGDSATQVRGFYALGGADWREVGRSSFVQSSPITSLKMWADPRGGTAYHAAGFGRLEQVTGSDYRVLSYAPALRDVTVSSPTSAFAVGWNLFLARWNGTSWTVDRPPAGTSTVRILQSVWSDGPSNAWAVGNANTILHWNGSGWSLVSDAVKPIAGPADSYNAVWGVGSSVWVAGEASLLRCTSVSACASQSVPSAGPLYSIWGTGVSNVMAVGAGGRILHYDGSTWTLMNDPAIQTLRRIWGSSASDVWAVGDSVLVHYDGTAWKNVPMTGELAAMQSGPSPLQSVFQLGLWGTGPKDVYLGAEGGRIARFDGTAWHAMPTSSTRRVLAISGVPGFGALAVTESQSFGAGPILLRGIGPSGGFSAAMTAPASWP